jgi:DNA ligase 1
MKPLLAHVYDSSRVDLANTLVQPKLNGVRALAGTDRQGRWRFQSRDEIPWDYEILEHLSCELKRLNVPSDWVLDGELYIHGWPLQRINSAITPVRKSTSSDTPFVQYHVFDMVDNAAFEQRHQRLYNCLRGTSDLVIPVPTYRALSITGQTHETLYAQFVSQGYEGVMYRVGPCPYTTPKQTHWNFLPPNGRTKYWSDRNNRSWHLLKRKDWQDGEFICVGVKEGEGKREGMVGAFVCKTTASKEFHVGSFLGFTDTDLVHNFLNPPVGRRLKIKYLCLSSDNIPLNPTLLTVL